MIKVGMIGRGGNCMPLTVSNLSPTRRTWVAGFYWIGVVMAFSCIALVLFSSSEVIHRFEHTDFPLTWVFAGIALLSFLAAELCSPEKSLSREAEDKNPSIAVERETIVESRIALAGIRPIRQSAHRGEI